MRKLTEEDLRLKLFRLSSGWGKTGQLKIFCNATGMLTPHVISKSFKCCKFKSLYFDSNSSGFICSLAETEKQQIDGKRNITEHIQKEGQWKNILYTYICIVLACCLLLWKAIKAPSSWCNIQIAAVYPESQLFLKTWFRPKKTQLVGINNRKNWYVNFCLLGFF